jgi:hypothetical protein
MEIGLTSTKASNARGSVCGSTKTSLREIPKKPAFMTALGERRSRPSVVTHQEHEALVGGEPPQRAHQDERPAADRTR